MRTIKITIHNGEVKIEGEGFKGKGCLTEIAKFSEGLPSKGQHKAEFFQQAPAVVHLGTGKSG